MNLKDTLNKVVHLRNQGELEERQRLLKKLLKKFIGNPYVNLEMGLLFITQKDFKSALSYFIKSNNIQENDEIKKQIINCYYQLKKYDDALLINQKLLNKNPDDIQIKLFQAKILRDKGDHDGSIEIYQQILEMYPKQVELLVEFGFALNKANLYEEAIDKYKDALKLNPSFLPAIYNLGIAFSNNKNYQDAILQFSNAIKIQSDIEDFWFARALAFIRVYQFEDALHDLDQILKFNPNHYHSIFQKGVIYASLNQSDKAMKYYLQAQAITDQKDNEISFRIALLLFKDRKFEEGVKYWTSRSKLIDRYEFFDDEKFESISNKKPLLIHRDQGLGDELLFLRLIGKLCEDGFDITYVCHEKLYDLLRLNFKNIKVVSEENSSEYLNNEKYQKITIGTILGLVHNPLSYIKNCKKIVAREYKFKKNNQKMRIGLSWKSKNEAIGDYKSYKLDMLSPILDDSKYEFINLQYGDVNDEINEVKNKFKIKIYEEEALDVTNNIADLCSLIESCDIVITCSNITAHVAGWLNKPTLLLLPKDYGKLWYWYHQNKTFSEWYPSINIINQDKSGEWFSMVEKIKSHLSKFKS